MYELNLIPYIIKEKKQRDLKIRKIISAAIIAIFFLFISLYVPKAVEKSFINREERLKADVLKNSSIIGESKKISSEAEELKSYIKKVETLTSGRVFAGERIRSIEKFIPADVSLDSLIYNMGTINITGKTKNYNSISIFAANLQVSKSYKSARISSIIYNPDESGYTFSINLSF